MRFMEAESLSPASQESAIFIYLGLRNQFHAITVHLCLNLQSGLFPSNYLTKCIVQNNTREADICVANQRNFHI
jgi:hypothetical protein